MAAIGKWLKVADQHNGQEVITDLIVFDDGGGDRLYGSTYGSRGCRLFRYDDVSVITAWEEVAGEIPGGDNAATSIVEFKGKLYASTYGGGPGTGGKLIEWNGTDAWSVVAPRVGVQSGIWNLIVFDDGGGDAIYGGTFRITTPEVAGQLFKWNGVNAWLVAAPKFVHPYRGVWGLCEYKGDLFGGTSNGGSGHGGDLLKWNKVNAWSLVAPGNRIPLNDSHILSLAVYDNGSGEALYAGCRGGTGLIRWNDVDAWETVVYGYGELWSLLVFDGKLLAGLGGGYGALLQYEDDATGFTLAADHLHQRHTNSLVEYKGEVYGGMGNYGYLYKYIPPSAAQRFITDVNDEIYQQFF